MYTQKLYNCLWGYHLHKDERKATIISYVLECIGLRNNWKDYYAGHWQSSTCTLSQKRSRRFTLLIKRGKRKHVVWGWVVGKCQYSDGHWSTLQGDLLSTPCTSQQSLLISVSVILRDFMKGHKKHKIWWRYKRSSIMIKAGQIATCTCRRSGPGESWNTRMHFPATLECAASYRDCKHCFHS